MIIIDLWDRPASPEPGPGTSGTPAVGPWAVWWGRLAGFGIRFVKNDNICLTSPLSAAFIIGDVNAFPWASMDFSRVMTISIDIHGLTGTSFMDFHRFVWIRTGLQRFLRISMDTDEYALTSVGLHGFNWLPRFPWNSLDFPEFPRQPWISWVFCRFQEVNQDIH